MMGSTGLDNSHSQWLSINEDALFLHDGLIRVTDLVDLPTDVDSTADSEHEVITFDTKNPTELSHRILTLCGKQNNGYARLMEYRLNALRGLWSAQRQLTAEPNERENGEHEDTIAILKKQGLWQPSEASTSFSSRVSLLLVFPLLQSQSRTDPALCGITTDLLLHCLRDCPPLSLAKEPNDCLNGLETLLCDWLGENANIHVAIRDAVHKENAAASLVALACARGSIRSFIHSVHLLQNLPDLGSLSVADILQKLLELEGGVGCASSLLGTKHILCWDFEDFLTPAPEKETTEKDKENDYKRSIACDGKFLYTTSCSGHNLSKVGNGYHGTLRGCLYAKNVNLGPGLVAWGSGVLLFRPYEFDNEKEDGRLALLLNSSTLQAEGKIILPADCIPDVAVTTVQFTSDGCYFYWLWVPRAVADKKSQTVSVDVFRLKENEVEVVPVQKRVSLQRKDETANKLLNDSLLARFRPFRSTAAATLVALTGTGSSSSTPSQETAAVTSCGLPLKNLVRFPIYTCGNSIVIVSSVPGSGNNSTARSLFGSGSNLASLRALATNLCFNVSDGQFSSRTDLVDAPTSSLARGAPLQGLGICYDALNNMIWLCSNHWIDQFFNPGHQAAHHVSLRLGTDAVLQPPPPDNRLTLPEVIRLLMQHVGTTCFHQVTCYLPHPQIRSTATQQEPIDLTHLRRLLDVLEIALRVGDPQIINCTLIVLQVLFKTYIFKLDNPLEVQLVKRTSSLIWQLMTSTRSPTSFKMSHYGPQRWYGIHAEACNVISSGLHVLYPTAHDRTNLLHQLFTEGSSEGPLTHLRNLILLSYTEQLQNANISGEESERYRLTDDLIHFLLKIVVRESCLLLRKCVIADREEFDQVLTSVPTTSPSLQYLSALQSHLLREAILFKPSNDDPTPSPLEKTQHLVLNFASKVLGGAFEVLEVLLEVCSSLVHGSISDYDYWVSGLERVTKATVLGHLMPVLMSSLTHPNLNCLKIADELMPQLVQLVIVASQAAVLLRSQMHTLQQDTTSESTSETSVIPGESVTSESVPDSGFLSGLKVPTPWATGRTVESIHPVRDNYKFKEVVQIPGARCLYLRFDARCSTQYDYDKLVIYAGPNTNSKKVIEYGGNTFGYGSRSVLGSGWPKDLVKVDGDTVTFSFEMRSGREHNTPDKAVWGFSITVRAQESAEEMSSGLPFLADIALGLSVLSCTMLQLLYQGPVKSADEAMCEQLLQSRLLHRCIWQSEPSATLSSTYPTSPRVAPIDEDSESNAVHFSPPRLAGEKLKRLRELSGCVAPQLRPSIRDCLHPEVFEERIVSCVMMHLALGDVVRQLSMHQEHETHDFKVLVDVLKDAFCKIDSITRRLQALAELEQRWLNELSDVAQGLMFPGATFFADYHLCDGKKKELALLCFLKNIDYENLTLEECVNRLRQTMEKEAANITEPPTELTETKKLVLAILERTEVLLCITIDTNTKVAKSATRSTPPRSHETSPSLEATRKPGYNRSISAPSALEGSVHEILPVRKSKSFRKRMSYPWQPSSILHDALDQVEAGGQELPIHLVILEQLFAFISSNPKEVISCNSFLSAVQIRYQRGMTRTQALIHMKELLTAASRVGGATHLVAAVTSVLQKGPRIEELTCGGMVPKVREAFADAMTSVVQLASRSPIACCNSVGLLCVIPYTRCEESCLVKSGLVHLLDCMCSLSSCRSEAATDPHPVRQRVSAMAWAGFQVLSNCCVMWEQEENNEYLEHSGLASQVATLLTNHLARATENNGNEAADSETLQEVLSLLNNLSRSNMGKAILSQPACVSKLLSLLLDQRPSPKLVLIILQLCRVALPLMSADDCAKVVLPAWGSDLHPDEDEQLTLCDPSARIASLLLAKLGDYVIPGCQTTLSRQSSRDSSGLGGSSGSPGTSQDKDRADESDVQDGRLSVFIHKREDQTSHDVIQPLISSNSDNRVFRTGTSGNMERVVRMDRELSKYGKLEMCTEDAASAWRRAAKLAQGGLVVSTGVPIEGTGSDLSLDKKKSAVDVSCREKNAELAKTDPVRPFISGHVANSMASEVIALLHSLLTATADEIWAVSVEKVLCKALAHLPQVVQKVEQIGTPQCNLQQLMSLSCSVNAALCALGGFKESIKAGSEVVITGNGMTNSTGQVLSISEQQGIATIKLTFPNDGNVYARACDIVHVPLSRLTTHQNLPLPLEQLSLTHHLVVALHNILVQDNGKSPLQTPLPNLAEGSLLAMAVCRVVAEIRTRACMVLAHNLHNTTFASAFMQNPSRAIDILKYLAKDCPSGHRLTVAELQCERLRMLYRDCAKPPLPPSKSNGRMKEITWDASRSYPPVRSSVFSYGMSAVTFLGDPSMSSGLPRGTLVYATQPIPHQAPSFYWELEICSFGESQDDTGPIISFGFAPPAEKKDGAWTNPVGTVLFHNNGRAVHYNGSSLLQWKSVRLDVALNPGDIAGCGWERTGESPELPAQQAKGVIFFTHNGQRLAATLEDVSGGLWPIVHIQKKNTRVRANFGVRHFAYAEGQQHRNAANEAADSTEEISANFGILPFHCSSDTESDNSDRLNQSTEGRDGKGLRGVPCRVATTPKPQKEYNSEASLHYKLPLSYMGFLLTGPSAHAVPAGQVGQEDESDGEDSDDQMQQEDYHALLVKAWESKVFPVIRRRFRNEAERKDGLEQIRGALQLGMTDIARQTVEFLYEENGGMPRDIHLPTLEDIKEEASRFTIERVRKGMAVVIRSSSSTSCGTTVLPKYAVHSMLKTFGLTGVVLDVDTQQELVQVETYLRSEGILVRYWYPVDILERPPAGFRKTAVTGAQILDTNSIHIHRELIFIEIIVAKMYCRQSLLELVDQCNDPNFSLDNASLSTAMAASAALLQELDIENLQLLSDELLAPPSPGGSVGERSLDHCHYPDQLLIDQTCTVTSLFFNDHSWLQRELVSAISRTANQGEDYLIELTTQICMCLQLAPECFPHEDFVLSEAKLSTDVHFQGAAFVIASCKSDPKTCKKEPPTSKTPWAHVFTYSGHQVQKNGQVSRQEVICYPRDASSSGCSAPTSLSNQYPAVVLPTDRVHVRLGGCTFTGMTLTLHAVPPQLPLALAYIEVLLAEKRKELPPRRNVAVHDSDSVVADPKPVKITSAVLLQVIELLGNYLWRTDVPAVLKERLFHLLAELLRSVHHAEDFSEDASLFPTLGPQLSPSLALLLQLQSELRKLYEEETKTWTSSSTPSGVGMGLGVGDHGRFSSYFQALMELSLAVAEVTSPITPALCSSGLGLAASVQGGSSPPPTAAPSSPSASSKRKKLKAKRDRDRMSPKSRSGSSSPRSSICEPDTSGASSSGSGVLSITSIDKPEDTLWFHRALTMSQILRFLVDGDPQGTAVTSDAISDASQSLVTPTAPSRLLVITGIPTYLPEDQVKKVIRSSLRGNGGLYRDEIFVPTLDCKSDKPPDLQDADGGESSNEFQDKPKLIKGCAVIEVRSRAKMEIARKMLLKNKALMGGLSMDLGTLPDDIMDVPENILSVSTVNQSLQTSDAEDGPALELYLQSKLLLSMNGTDLNDTALIALTEIFHSCFLAEQRLCLSETRHSSGFICLSKEQIMSQVQGNLLCIFFSNVRASKRSLPEHIAFVLMQYGLTKTKDKDEFSANEKSEDEEKDEKLFTKKRGKSKVVADKEEFRPCLKKETRSPEKMTKETSDGEREVETVLCEEKFLTLDGFAQYVCDRAQQDVRAVWLGFLACGYDLHFDRCSCMDTLQAQQMSKLWSNEMDSSLCTYTNNLCHYLAITPARLHPHEIYLSPAELTSPEYSSLQEASVESVRLRFALLQSLNNTLETFFLPLVDLRPATPHPHSTAALLTRGRSSIFYDTKVTLMNRVLNATVQRKLDQAAPEIILDPLEGIGSDLSDVTNTQFCQALRQLAEVPSSQFCVRLASGGDPTFSFNVRPIGEEVHGTSGSFRHFLSQVSKELQGPWLSLLLLCPSSAANVNKGKFILQSGLMTYSEEKLLNFFGQLLGITIRADIPLPLDLLQTVWKVLVNVGLDPGLDLKEADIITYNFVKKFCMVENPRDFQQLLEECNHPSFVYSTMGGEEVELCPDGRNVAVNWHNHQQFVSAIRCLRLHEMNAQHRVVAIKAGLASIVPLQLLNLMTPQDLEMRTCGIPEIDLDFLKAHTMYQVGLMETDVHIEFFWTALESLSQDELRKFIKFACNQDRIPNACPCRDGQSDTAHVPPYPMKIAPPDGKPGSPDSRYIRVETCMFMIKLPQYSSQEIMTERLLYAIHCREDPLSG